MLKRRVKNTILVLTIVLSISFLFSFEKSENILEKYFYGFWCNRFPASDYSSGYIFKPDRTYEYFSLFPKNKNSLYYGNSGNWRINGTQIQIEKTKVYYWKSKVIKEEIEQNSLIYKEKKDPWVNICNFENKYETIISGIYTRGNTMEPIIFLMRTEIDEETYSNEKYVMFSLLKKLDPDAQNALIYMQNSKKIE
jgi:hypothetical protein